MLAPNPRHPDDFEPAFDGRRPILALCVAGGVLSLLLQYVHHRAHVAPGEGSLCAIDAAFDCETVALSRYAVLLGVPLPLWGAAAYLGMGLAALRASRWLIALSAVAALAGVALTALSLAVVHAVCLACEVLHALSLVILICALRARAQLAAVRMGAGAGVLLPPAALLCALAAWLPAYWGASAWAGALPFPHGTTPEGHAWLGAEQPRLTLVEVIDHSCPHCRVASEQLLSKLEARKDELRVVRRFYPRARCEGGQGARCLSLRFALCAGEQDRFWQADRWLFESASGGRDPDVERGARELGLDATQLAECVSRASTIERAVAEWRWARKLHLPGTPYYVHEGRPIGVAAAAALIDAL